MLPKAKKYSLFTLFDILFQPVDASLLGFFRVLFGILLLIQVYWVYSHSFILEFYVKPLYHFPFSLFEFLHLPRLNFNQWIILFNVMGIAALGITLGLCFRLSCFVFFTTFLYAFLFEKSLFYEYNYLILLVTFIFMISDADRWPLLNNLRVRKITTQTVPYWPVLLLRFQFWVAYLYGGLSKLNADWVIYAEPMYSRILLKKSFLGVSLHNLGLAYFLSYAGLVINLAIPVLLVFKRTRVPAFLLAFLFNAANYFLFKLDDVRIFPLMMMVALVLFLDPDAPREFLGKVRDRVLKRKSASVPVASGQSFVYSNFYRKAVTCFFCGYVFFQLLFPLRHLIYPGEARWTFEGTRFAWRYKLNAKDVKMKITCTDPRTGKKINLPWERQVSSYQVWLDNVPDMLLQFIHYKRDELIKQGILNPIINVEAYASLNGRPYQLYIDPKVNLADVQYPLFSHARWVLPLEKKRD